MQHLELPGCDVRFVSLFSLNPPWPLFECGLFSSSSWYPVVAYGQLASAYWMRWLFLWTVQQSTLRCSGAYSGSHV
jgi:hypothetical protein